MSDPLVGGIGWFIFWYVMTFFRFPPENPSGRWNWWETAILLCIESGIARAFVAIMLTIACQLITASL